MQPVPKGVVFGVGLSLLLVVAAGIASQRPPPRQADVYGTEWADSCFRYGRFECCVRGEETP